VRLSNKSRFRRLRIREMNKRRRAKSMRIPTARLIFCLAASGVAAGCASSSASGPKISTVDQSFLRGINSYDQNRDGAVTCDEWRAAAAEAVKKANNSGSGFLNEEESRNLALSDRTFVVATFKYYDVNGDGKIDRKEFVERPNPAFTYADKDADCRLTEPELLAARNLSAPTTEAPPRRSAIGTGAPPGTGGGY
jgi:Ca2+-binding EF-hand superfamily protein